jgi:hypothetical protein
VIAVKKIILTHTPILGVDKSTIFDKVVSTIRMEFSLSRGSFLMPPKKKGGNVWKSKGESF